MLVGPSGNVAPLGIVQLTATTPSTASVAVALYVKTAPPAAVASTVALAGTVTTGPTVSITVTVNEAATVLPRVSVAVHDTVVVARGKIDPLAGVQSAATFPSTASLAVALNVKLAPAGLVACAVAFGGTVKAGAVVSCTVTVKLPVPTFPRPSRAVHVTVVAPNGKVAPLAGVQIVATLPSRRSVADAV